MTRLQYAKKLANMISALNIGRGEILSAGVSPEGFGKNLDGVILISQAGCQTPVTLRKARQILVSQIADCQSKIEEATGFLKRTDICGGM